MSRSLWRWIVSGKEPGYTEVSIFLPYAGIRDQNIWERSAVGGRGVYWSSTDGGSGAYYLNGNSINSHNQPHGCSVRAICVADEPVVEGVYILDDTYPKATLYQFETYTGDNPRLILKTPRSFQDQSGIVSRVGFKLVERCFRVGVVQDVNPFYDRLVGHTDGADGAAMRLVVRIDAVSVQIISS